MMVDAPEQAFLDRQMIVVFSLLSPKTPHDLVAILAEDNHIEEVKTSDHASGVPRIRDLDKRDSAS